MTRNFSVKDRRDIRHLDKGNPYYEYKKYTEPTECSGCGLVYASGRWVMKTARAGTANKELCPACRLIRDKQPLGIAVFEGDGLDDALKTEVKNIIKNIERKVTEKRPLQRVMSIEEGRNTLTVQTTYDHIARRMGEAVYKAHKGELTIKYVDGERFARIYWRKD